MQVCNDLLKFTALRQSARNIFEQMFFYTKSVLILTLRMKMKITHSDVHSWTNKVWWFWFGSGARIDFDIKLLSLLLLLQIGMLAS